MEDYAAGQIDEEGSGVVVHGEEKQAVGRGCEAGDVGGGVEGEGCGGGANKVGD